MLIADWLQQTIQQLKITGSELEARTLLTHVTGLTSVQQRLSDKPLDSAQLAQLQDVVQRRIDGEPLAYIVGWQPFYGLNLRVTPDTLIPRGETEFMVELIVNHCQHLENPLIIDLGTGSGAIALALKRTLPNSRVIASDNSLHALKVASDNALSNAIIDNRAINSAGQTSTGSHSDTFGMNFVAANWLDAFNDACADIIVSNPPYIAPLDSHLNALSHEPQSALVATDNGYADLFTIIQSAPRVLKPNAWLYLEHGYQQAKQLQTVAKEMRTWQHIQTHNDHASQPRVLALQRLD